MMAAGGHPDLRASHALAEQPGPANDGQHRPYPLGQAD